MNRSFGLDHALIAVNDIEALRQRLISIGFTMTPVGRHPWGTSNSLAMFDGCLIEIMGIYDEALLDEHPTQNFRFGRHVYEHLLEQEGIALTALHSVDAHSDTKRARDAGFEVAGELEFGRDVCLPDGTCGRTKTTLVTLPDHTYPRLSFFLCQQHRPDLIYVPQWLEHNNSAHGISGMTIVATQTDRVALSRKFSKIYRSETVKDRQRFQTPNGYLDLLLPEEFESSFCCRVPGQVTPQIMAIDIACRSEPALESSLKVSELPFKPLNGGWCCTTPELTGNVVLQFSCNPATKPIKK